MTLTKIDLTKINNTFIENKGKAPIFQDKPFERHAREIVIGFVHQDCSVQEITVSEATKVTAGTAPVIQSAQDYKRQPATV